MTFEEAEAALAAARKSQLARLMWEGASLPDTLTEAERTFCFGLYVYTEYEQRDMLKKYFID